MRIIFSLLCFLLVNCRSILFAQETPGKSEVLQFSLKQSKLYPGTSRSYWIYIPKKYTPEKPACLFVSLDGVMFNAPAVFDSLIASKEMPVTIGVFIQSGNVMNSNGEVIRYNRTNEFDNMNDRFARFIETEILPDVLKQKTSGGKPIRISTNANDHAIAGASSGAICAFTAAWQRPNLFSRVFSAIGTYIGMRGGDQYPVLIRKTEPRPIRVYLQDNKNDTWNPLFGNWFLSNIDMEAALNFAGYELTHTWQEGGHDSRPATTIFADAMRWLWKDWPQAVTAGQSGNELLRSIIDTNEQWQPVIKTITSGNGTSSRSVLMPNGDQYILKNGTISYKTKQKTTVLDKDADLGTALAVSPDKAQLVVSSKHSYWLYDYTILADGRLANKQSLYWLHNPGNDTVSINSLAFDQLGNLYAATPVGVQVCDQNGRVRAILSLPAGAVTGLWFGGENFNTLFVNCSGKLYKRTLKVAGAMSFQKALKPASQGGG